MPVSYSRLSNLIFLRGTRLQASFVAYYYGRLLLSCISAHYRSILAACGYSYSLFRLFILILVCDYIERLKNYTLQGKGECFVTCVGQIRLTAHLVRKRNMNKTRVNISAYLFSGHLTFSKCLKIVRQHVYFFHGTTRVIFFTESFL